MTFNTRSHYMRNSLPSLQKGALTMISAVLILILLTALVIYAAQVGVFEQRKSGNELRQKQAFHSAEVGIQRGMEYLLANVLDITSLNNTTGWLSETHMSDGGTGRWIECDGNYSETSGPHAFWHPCYGEGLDGENGEPNFRDVSFFYSEDGSSPTPIPIPIAGNPELMDRASEAAEVYALLCMLDVTPNVPQPVQGCLAPSQRGQFDSVYFAITLLARGQSECDDSGLCRGEALVAQRIGSYGPVPGSGGPGAPLTSKTRLHPGGTVEIVPNPNGGGPGVPVSVWIEGNEDGTSKCPGGTPAGELMVDPASNSWATCEMHEWYGVDVMPEDFTCPDSPCNCDSHEQMVSHGNQDNVRYDIVIDPDFPCDLFFHVFESNDVEDVKSRFTVLDDCAKDELGPLSRGPIWISTDDVCRYNAGMTIGSPTDPVFLVYSTPEVSFNGGVTLYGVIMTTAAEDRAGEFNAGGGGTIYGAVLVEGEIEPNYGSNFEIVWNDELVRNATKKGGLGKLYGGWTDFHEDWR